MFDNIIVLTNGGKVAYSGPSQSMLAHFGSMGHILPIHTNPSDFILDLCSIDLRTPNAESTSRARVNEFVQKWKEVGPTWNQKDNLEEGNPEGNPISSVIHRRSAPFNIAFPVLASRSLLNTRRQPVLVISRVLQVTFLGVIQSLFYAPQGYGQVSVQNRIGVLQQTLATLFIG